MNPRSLPAALISVAARGAGAALRRRPPTLDGVRLVDYWTVGGIGPRTVDFLAAQIAARRPRRILECGPGTSTVAMARAAEALGMDTTITSLEHDEAWAAVVRRRLRRAGLERRVEIVVSPLAARSGEPFPWYRDAGRAAARGPFDLLFIDGPPAIDGEPRRWPAAPRFWDALTDGALIVLDDGRRAGERECVRLWREQFGAGLEGDLAAVEKGLWALEKRALAMPDAEVVVAPWVKRAAGAL